mgnify:FL=1
MRDTLTWRNVGPLENIPVRGARRLCLQSAGRPVAIFRTAGDEVFALIDECPHRRGPLSEGIVSGTIVTCPLHDWAIELCDGQAVGPDEGAARTLPVRIIAGQIFIGLPTVGGGPA